LRPFARRRDKTAWPLLVFIRCRNPCTLERWRRFGWNVRLGILLTAPASRNVDEQRKSINDLCPFGQTGPKPAHISPAPSQSYIFFAFSAPSAMHWPISHLTNSSEGAKVSTLRRKICSTVLFGQPCIRASIRLRFMFFGLGPDASAVAIYAPHLPASQVLFVVPVGLSLFSDEILKSVQPSPSRATTLAFPQCVRQGSSRSW